MKNNIFFRLDAPTVRLASTYLSIIMMFIIGFSVLFYHTSTGNLSGLNVSAGTHGTNDTSAPASSASGGLSASSIDGKTVTTSKNATDLNTQLQQQVRTIKNDLIHRLFFLSIGSLVVASAFSLYLARRTLRPMELAMDQQARFSSDASHELRTPLTALRARNEVALRKTGLTLAEARRVMQSSVEQVIKLEKLSEGLLELSQSDSQAPTIAPISLSQVTSEAMNRVIEQAQAKRISIEDTTPNSMVIGNLDTLVQVITILLDNAIKYSHRGSTIFLESDSEGKYQLLHVRDEGIGISAVDLPHIFNRFYRADEARTKQGKHGYGLGLSIAKKLVENNKGELTVLSVSGKGSTFTIKLPRSQP